MTAPDAMYQYILCNSSILDKSPDVTGSCVRHWDVVVDV